MRNTKCHWTVSLKDGLESKDERKELAKQDIDKDI